MNSKLSINLTITTIIIITLISIASADVIVPGTKYVDVTNVVTNMNDFQNYYLLLVEDGGRIERLDDGGIIQGGYSQGYVSIYAIKKDLASSSGLNITKDGSVYKDRINITTDKYLESIGAVELAENIVKREYYPTSSPIESITYRYTLELGKVKTSPDSTTTEKNLSGLTYLIISLIALIIIIYLVIRRKR
jgi:hypothetical protein